MNYYNEFDPVAAAILTELIKAGEIPLGYVDTRSIVDVTANDLRGFTGIHLFAGIGTWAYALRRAGWADNRPVWTASCPCQPFSDAGKKGGINDDRHLWPEVERLREQLKPVVIFGEQVSSADGLAWFDIVSSDLENAGYSTGAIDICAASVGAPHMRQRLYWVGYALGEGWEGQPRNGSSFEKREETHGSATSAGAIDEGGGSLFWNDPEWVSCSDGKFRPIQPGISPLVDGTPGHVDLCRVYGNGIVTQNATEFIASFMDVVDKGIISA